jgi:uncharacterized protein
LNSNLDTSPTPNPLNFFDPTASDPEELYEQGIRFEKAVPPDESMAREKFEAAAKLGFGPALSKMGYFHSKGKGGLFKSETESAKLYKSAADRDDPMGMYNMGVLAQKGRGGVAQDEEAAARWFRRAAKRGHARAQYNLGLMCEAGRGGMPHSDARAASLFSRAAERGHPAAQHRLAAYHERGLGGVAKDPVAAARWYLRAAESGHQPARECVGKWYPQAVTMKQDHRETAAMLRAAAGRGSVVAMLYFAALQEDGSGVPVDVGAAARWYHRAALEGCAPAQVRLGCVSYSSYVATISGIML